MEERKSFLKILEESDVDFNFRMLTDEGYGNKATIPVQWLYSKGISAQDFVQTMEKFVMQAVLKRGKDFGKTKEQTIEFYEFNRNKRNPGMERIEDFEVRKDENGHVYLLITGLDNYAKVAIHQDDQYISDKGVFRVRESKFIEKLKQISDRRKVEEILRENGGSISIENLDMKEIYKLIGIVQSNDVNESLEQAGKNLVRYTTYMRNMQESETESIISCHVAEETTGKKRPRGDKPSEQTERVNEIMHAKERFDFLRNLNPEYVIKVNPLRSGDDNKKYEYQAFTYDLSKKNQDEEGAMIIIEPENGVKRTRIVYISNEDMKKIEEDLIAQGEEDVDKRRVFEQVIVNTLGKTPSQIATERKVKQTNHTTIEAFKANCEYFVFGKKDKLKEVVSSSNAFRKMEDRREMLDDDRDDK